MQLRRQLQVLLLSLSGAVGHAVVPESKELTFTIPANSTTTVNLTSSAGVGDTNQPGFINETTALYAGTIGASIEFNPETLAVTGFQYTGGTVDREEIPAAMAIYPVISYNTGETLFTSIVRSTSANPPTTQFSRFTPTSVGDLSVDPVTGAITGVLRWTTSVGVEIINGSRTGNILDIVVSPPLPPLQRPHTADPSIVLQETSATSFLRTIRGTLTYDFSSLQSHDIPISTAQAIVTETGSWSATSNFTLPTDYGQWAIDNGLNNPDPEGTNEAGIPNVFLYSLDLPGDARTLPISVVPVDNFYQVQIVLPESGLKTAMKIEYSFSMADGTWQELSPFFYPSPDALDVGATGSPSFPFPLPGRCFMRFVTEL